MSDIEKFRGAEIPKIEIKALKAIEKSIRDPRWEESFEKFEMVDSIDYDPENIDPSSGITNEVRYQLSDHPALFVVRNNRVVSLCFQDPNDCEYCEAIETWYQCDNCGLKIPYLINDFTALEGLYIIGNYHHHSKIPDSVFNLSSLKILFLEKVRLGSRVSQKIDNLKSLVSLHLNETNLSRFPASIKNLDSLINLDLSHNKISKLPTSLSKLKYLTFSGNNLEEISNSIGDLEVLEYLDLSYNSLTTLPDSITDLRNLRGLELFRNNIKSLPKNIHLMKSLEALSLEQNELTSLPENIGEIPSLKSLNVMDNHITNIPDSLINKSLENLLVERNPIKSFPKSKDFITIELLHKKLHRPFNYPLKAVYLEEAKKLLNYKEAESIIELESLAGSDIRIKTENYHVKELDMQSIKEKHIPESIGELIYLEKLAIMNSEVESIPNSFGNFTQLEKLDLRYNKFGELPNSFGKLISLKELKLTENLLEKLPTSIGNLSQLIELDISQNRLLEIPESIGNLASLESLKLEDNKIDLLPKSIGKLHKLRILYLHKNNLQELPKTIGGLKSLTKLEMYDNSLKRIPTTIGELSNLESLSISNNKLEQIPESIRQLKTLKRLSLGHNYLKTLPENMIDDLSALENLFLDGNKLPSKYNRNFHKKDLLLRKDFSVFLKELDNLPEHEKYDYCDYFVNSIRNPEILNKNYSQIKYQLQSYLKSIDQLYGQFQVNFYSELLKVAKEIGWIKEFYPQFLKAIEKFEDPRIDKNVHREELKALLSSFKNSDK
ncbi:MAG: hypothetical protein HWN80_19140 [Candidatus Lokiarchaeota archaeon]|nr:hypothetical protein [Candidatus Lokiarchaeota archaeon]